MSTRTGSPLSRASSNEEQEMGRAGDGAAADTLSPPQAETGGRTGRRSSAPFVNIMRMARKGGRAKKSPSVPRSNEISTQEGGAVRRSRSATIDTNHMPGMFVPLSPSSGSCIGGSPPSSAFGHMRRSPPGGVPIPAMSRTPPPRPRRSPSSLTHANTPSPRRSPSSLTHDAMPPHRIPGLHSDEIERGRRSPLSELLCSSAPTSVLGAELEDQALPPRADTHKEYVIQLPGSERCLKIYSAKDAHNSAQRPDFSTFIRVLLGEPYIFRALCDITTYEQSEKNIKPFVSLYSAADMFSSVCDDIIGNEIESTRDETTLFRELTVGSAMISAYTNLMGVQFVRLVIRPLVTAVVLTDESMEVDPSRVLPGENVMANMMCLVRMCNRVFDHIFESISECPPSIWRLCSKVATLVDRKFCAAKRLAVAGVFFLRFLCPVIVNPDGTGALNQILDRNSRRKLVLVSKGLQSLANGVEFDGTKEAYMMGLNKFVHGRRSKMNELLDLLAAGPPENAQNQVAIQGVMTDHDCVSLAIVIRDNSEGIRKQLANQEEKAAFDDEFVKLAEECAEYEYEDESTSEADQKAWSKPMLSSDLAAALLRTSSTSDDGEHGTLIQVGNQGTNALQSEGAGVAGESDPKKKKKSLWRRGSGVD